MVRWQKNLVRIAIALLFATIASFIVLKSLNDNIIFFLSPSELHEKLPTLKEGIKFRLGGMVKDQSIVSLPGGITEFILTDLQDEFLVRTNSVLPNLFKPGQGAIAYGQVITLANGNKIFLAEEILAKHDENYMPKEIADALKKSGNWRDDSNSDQEPIERDANKPPHDLFESE